MLRVELVNNTAYRTEDLLALVLACLHHHGALAGRRVTVTYCRRQSATGRAQLPRDGCEGFEIWLRLPRPEWFKGDPDGVRLRVARVLDHEVAHTLGLGHRTMSRDLRWCRQAARWAEGLTLGVSEETSTSTAAGVARPRGGHGGRRRGAGRPRLGRGATVQIAIRLPWELLADLDRVIALRRLNDRSEAIRWLIEEAARRLA